MKKRSGFFSVLQFGFFSTIIGIMRLLCLKIERIIEKRVGNL